VTAATGGRDDRAGRAGRAGLGLFALALFAAAIGATWHFLHGGFRSGMAVEAVFSHPGAGQQLPVNGDVKIRGVLVGVISDIRLDGDGNAIVELSLDGDLDLPGTTRAEIRSKTIFGQKWVELIPPAETSGAALAAGSIIPDSQTKEPLELERALQLGHDLLTELPLRDLSVVFRELADGFSGHERAARQAIDRGLMALEGVNSRSAELDEALGQLAEFSAFLDDNDDDLLSFMESLDSANRALVGAAPELRSNLDSVPVFLTELASFQELTEDDLGALIEGGADLAEILAARDDQLVDLVVQLEAFLTVWNSGLQQPCAGEFEADMTCWQVYVVPGTESRGLYRRGGGPDRDEPGDPNAGAPVDRQFTEREIRSILSKIIEDRR
jgi:phospholipid/cholesterol/gamma-HCH transport system substrate-binding protein